MKFPHNFITVAACSCCPFVLTLLWEHIILVIYVADCGECIKSVFLSIAKILSPSLAGTECVCPSSKLV